MRGKAGIVVVLLVFVAAAVFLFLVAVDDRYSLPGFNQYPRFEQLPPRDIQSLLTQLRRIDCEVISLKERQKSFQDNLNSLQARRQAVVDEINDWMKSIRDQVNEPRTKKVLQPSDVLVPKR